MPFIWNVQNAERQRIDSWLPVAGVEGEMWEAWAVTAMRHRSSVISGSWKATPAGWMWRAHRSRSNGGPARNVAGVGPSACNHDLWCPPLYGISDMLHPTQIHKREDGNRTSRDLKGKFTKQHALWLSAMLSNICVLFLFIKRWVEARKLFPQPMRGLELSVWKPPHLSLPLPPNALPCVLTP